MKKNLFAFDTAKIRRDFPAWKKYLLFINYVLRQEEVIATEWGIDREICRKQVFGEKKMR